MSPKKSGADWPLPCPWPEEVGFSSERLVRIVPGLQEFVDKQTL